MGTELKISPDILVTLRFLSTMEGGRKGPTPPDSLSSILEYDGRFYDCRLLLRDVGSVAPGETKTVPIKLLFPELVKAAMREGEVIRLRESAPIAAGIIDKIYWP